MLNHITPLILTFNEAPNIARTLAQLSWARTVVIVDSLSSDGTRALAEAQHPGVHWFDRPFTTHAEQWNFGLTQTGIASEWILALDADFIASDSFISELQSLTPPDTVAGYRASFVYCIGGRPLKGAAYPPVVVLFRRSRATYHQDGHTQRVQVTGAIQDLTAPLHHDDRKPLTHWLVSQTRYMRLEAAKLASVPYASLTWPDRARRWIVVAPAAMLFYCLFVKGGIFNGRRGLFYAMQRAAAELMLSLYLLERALFE